MKIRIITILFALIAVTGCQAPKSAPIAEPDYNPTCEECQKWKEEMDNGETQEVPDDLKENAKKLLKKCQKLIAGNGRNAETSCPISDSTSIDISAFDPLL